MPRTSQEMDEIKLNVHRKKRFGSFPFPAGMSLPISLGGNYDVITELFLPRSSLVSDIPAGDGKLTNLFLRCRTMRFGRIIDYLYRCEPLIVYEISRITDEIKQRSE
jgi:hypothetical protein